MATADPVGFHIGYANMSLGRKPLFFRRIRNRRKLTPAFDTGGHIKLWIRDNHVDSKGPAGCIHQAVNDIHATDITPTVRELRTHIDTHVLS